MSNTKFTGKTAKFFVTVLIGLIIASFALTTIGTGGLSTSPGSVAEVGDYAVSPREYNIAYNQIQQQYNQIFAGQAIPDSLTASMQKSAMNRLVNQKIILNLADKFSLNVSPDEVKDTIKKQDVFLTENQFDFNKYQQLLKSNGFSPKSYEEAIQSDLKSQHFYEMLGHIKSSKNFGTTINEIKKAFIPITVAKIESYSLRDFVPVSQNEISEYLKVDKNEATLEAIYQEKVQTYQQPASYTYRTIFINKLGKDDATVKKKVEALRKTLTKANFSQVAKKESDDTVNKASGGLSANKTLSQIPADEKAQILKLKEGEISEVYSNSLGYNILYLENLKKAVNTPLDSVKNEIAKIAIQRSKTAELTKLYKDLTAEVQSELKNNNLKKVKELANKYKFELSENAELVRYTNTASNIEFKEDQTTELFNAKTGDTLSFDRITFSVVAKVLGAKQVPKVENDEELTDELQGQLTQKIIKDYSAKNPVSYNPNFQIQ